LQKFYMENVWKCWINVYKKHIFFYFLQWCFYSDQMYTNMSVSAKRLNKPTMRAMKCAKSWRMTPWKHGVVFKILLFCSFRIFWSKWCGFMVHQCLRNIFVLRNTSSCSVREWLCRIGQDSRLLPSLYARFISIRRRMSQRIPWDQRWVDL
jgi:hypothetical protein